MTNAVLGPGLVPGDVKVRCLACKRERTVRETEVESACPWCTNETKRAFEEARRKATIGRITQKKMLTRPTTSGPRRMMTCHRHGLTPWEGHVECGCGNPKLFFESESAAVFVLDGDHEHYVNARHANNSERQQAIVVEAPISTPFDTGAW